MPLPNLHIADICKLGKALISMQIADFLRKYASLRE
jgi:hypothetical protein